MSSFDTLESSPQDSRPLEVYTFSSPDETFRYTSDSAIVSLDGNDYAPAAISRGATGQASEGRNSDFLVTIKHNNEFVAKYISTPPGQKFTLEILRLQRDESPVFNTRIQIFIGTIQSARFKNSARTAEIVARSEEFRLNQTMPKYTYAGMCSHTLFDDQCTVNPASFNHIGTVTTVSGNTLTVNGLNSSGIDGTGGYCTPTGTNDFRMILSQSGDDIVLQAPFVDSPLGSSLQVFAGCDRRLTGDCANTFDNAINFGGCAFVPNRAIFTSGLEQV